MSVEYEHLHTVLYNPFFVGVCAGVCIGQCVHSINVSAFGLYEQWHGMESKVSCWCGVLRECLRLD